jgi:hypothetical protein
MVSFLRALFLVGRRIAALRRACLRDAGAAWPSVAWAVRSLKGDQRAKAVDSHRVMCNNMCEVEYAYKFGD